MIRYWPLWTKQSQNQNVKYVCKPRKKERERKKRRWRRVVGEREKCWSLDLRWRSAICEFIFLFYSLFKRFCSPHYQSFTATTNPTYELASSLCLLIFFKFLFMAEDLDVGFSDFLILIDISICDCCRLIFFDDCFAQNCNIFVIWSNQSKTNWTSLILGLPDRIGGFWFMIHFPFLEFSVFLRTEPF